MKKRFITLLLAVLLLVSAIPVVRVSAEDTGKKLVALTFDDGPGAYTERLLDGLKERNAKATFFIIGRSVNEKYKSTVKRAYLEGHQIASHSYNHKVLTRLTNDKITEQLDKTKDKLSWAIGRSDLTYIVRPPYGSFNDRVLSVLNAPSIYWSIDPEDWKYRNSATVYNNIVPKVRDGDIILLHDIHSTSVDAALKVIDELQKQGFEFVTVNELYRRKGTALQNGTNNVSCRGETKYGAVSTPEINVVEGTNGYFVTISGEDNAKIYYTTDGSDPALNGKLYTGGFAVNRNITVKALCAYNLNGSRGEVAERTLDIGPDAPEYSVKNNKIIITAEKGAKIYYTTDGTEPTDNSAQYSSPLTVDEKTIVRAVAFCNNCFSSETYITYLGGGYAVRDVKPTSWYYDAVSEAVCGGIISLTANQYFKPEICVTRASFIETLYHVAGDPEVTGTLGGDFSDISAGASCAKAVRWAKEKGIVNGEDGKFEPDRLVTREELATMFFRFVRSEDKDVSKKRGITSFNDWKSVSDFAVEPIGYMLEAGLLSGEDGNMIMPQANATRAQVAVIIMRYLQKN